MLTDVASRCFNHLRHERFRHFFTDCMIHNESISISAVHRISSVNGEIDDLLRLWEFFEGIAVSP